jgi:TP901 family phage tail tape measure protein
MRLDVGGAIGAARAFGGAVSDTAKKAASGVNSLSKTVDESTGRQRQAFDRLGRITTVAAVGMVGAFGLAVKATMDFDKQMSSVQAAAGATGGELQKLRTAAIQAGKDTAFSAREAAQGEEELAKAGVSTRDILGGGLKGALDLAAAGQIGVAEASETAATAMTQFRLSGSAVPHIADLLSAGANKAQGSVHDLSFALKQSGLVASQFGLSVEDTVGTLSAFASAGLIGSDAGTSFKTMLLSLANPSEKAADLMHELGINAYNAQGRFVGITNLAGQLHDRLGGLSQAQRDAALATIFGSDAIRAANVLYQQGQGGIQGWINKVNDSGNASRTAATKLNNLAGDLEQLRGSLETALIQTGSGANGALRQLTQTATGAVNVFNDLPAGVQSATIWIAGISGAALLGAKGLIFITTTGRDAKVALEALGLTSARTAALTGGLRTALGATAAFMAGPWGVAIAAGVGLVAAWAATKKDAAKATQEFTSAIQSDSGALGANTRAAVANKLEQEGVLKAAQSAGVNLGSLTDAVLGNSQAYNQVNDQIQAFVTQTNAAARSGKISADDAAKRIAAAMSLKEALEGQGGAIKASADAAKRQAAATKGTVAPQQQAAVVARQHASSEDALAKALHDASSTADDLRKALDALTKNAIDLEEANIAQARAAQAATKAATKHRGASLDEREALIKLVKADQDQLVAMKQSGATSDQLTSKMGSQRAAFLKVAAQMHINKARARELADQYFHIPKDVSTQVKTPGIGDAIRASKDMGSAVRDIPKTHNTTITAEIGAAMANLSRVRSAIVKLPGGGTARVASGRYADGGIRRYAAGGIRSFAGGGHDMPPHVATASTIIYGEPETGGEAYIPLGPGKRARSTALLAEVANEFGYALTRRISSAPVRLSAPATGGDGAAMPLTRRYHRRR